MNPIVPVLAVVITANVINGEDALEPSVVNEVAHALGRAPAVRLDGLRTDADVFATNGLPASAVAIRLVSLQKGDGQWFVNGTNRTAEAVAILSSLSGLSPKTGPAKGGGR